MYLKNFIKLILISIKGNFFWNYKLYLVNPSKYFQISSNDSKDLIIVIQGPILKSFTYETIKFYNTVFKDAIIILSTWKLDNNIKSSFKKLRLEIIENDYPDYKGYHNINYQIKSSSSGIKFAKKFNKRFIIKTRTDQRITQTSSIKNLKNLFNLFNSKNSSRLVACSLDSILSREFHLSDHFMFGEFHTMERYWSPEIDERDLSNVEINDKNQHKYKVGGSYFFIQYMLKYLKRELGSNYQQILSNHFIIVNKNDLGLYWNKYNLKFDKYIDNYKVNEKDFSYWLNLYLKYNK